MSPLWYCVFIFSWCRSLTHWFKKLTENLVKKFLEPWRCFIVNTIIFLSNGLFSDFWYDKGSSYCCLHTVTANKKISNMLVVNFPVGIGRKCAAFHTVSIACDAICLSYPSLVKHLHDNIQLQSQQKHCSILLCFFLQRCRTYSPQIWSAAYKILWKSRYELGRTQWVTCGSGGLKLMCLWGSLGYIKNVSEPKLKKLTSSIVLDIVIRW